MMMPSLLGCLNHLRSLWATSIYFNDHRSLSLGIDLDPSHLKGHFFWLICSWTSLRKVVKKAFTGIVAPGAKAQ